MQLSKTQTENVVRMVTIDKNHLTTILKNGH